MSKKIIFSLFISLFICSCGVYQGQYHGKTQARKPIMPAGRDYIVRRGDTLFSIAWKHGVSVNELMQWNSLDNPHNIKQGQVLHTAPYGRRVSSSRNSSSYASKAKSSNNSARKYVPKNFPAVSGWVWPTRGKIIQNYDGATPSKQGIRIAGSRGQSVNAAANGRVSYVGADVKFVGRMVMIEHANGLISIYGFLDNNIAVKEGQTVKKGQRIGSMGIGQQNMPILNFELHRAGGKSVNPLSYIGSTPHY